MRNCNAPVADRTAPFVFAIIHPEGTEKVYPLLELLAQKGLRIWYDDGTAKKDSHWAETYAASLCESKACMLLLTEHVFESHECRIQMLIAANVQIPLVSVYLEDVQLSFGEEMLISNGRILRCVEKDLNAAASAILEEAGLAPCIGAPNPDIQVQYSQKSSKSKWADWIKDLQGFIDPARHSDPAPAPKPEPKPMPAPTPKPEPAPAPIPAPVPIPAPAPIPAPNPISGGRPVSGNRASVPSGTVLIDYQSDGQAMGTVLLAQQEERPVILRLSTGEYKEGNPDFTTIGRSPYCDFSLQGEGQTGISEYHLRIVLRGGKRYLVDTEHSNGSFYSRERLPENQPVELQEDIAQVKLASEMFVIFFGKEAKRIRSQKAIFGLRSDKTLETRYILREKMALGRNHSWDGGVLTAKTTSAEHAVIQVRDGQCQLWDTSTNGTFVNGNRVARETQTAVSAGDRIRLAQECFTLLCLPLKKKE